MTPLARSDTQNLLCGLVPIWALAIAGCIAFGEWQELRQVRPDLQMAQTFMIDCLNSGNGRAIKVGREAVIVCAETE